MSVVAAAVPAERMRGKRVLLLLLLLLFVLDVLVREKVSVVAATVCAERVREK